MNKVSHLKSVSIAYKELVEHEMGEKQICKDNQKTEPINYFIRSGPIRFDHKAGTIDH